MCCVTCPKNSANPYLNNPKAIESAPRVTAMREGTKYTQISYEVSKDITKEVEKRTTVDLGAMTRVLKIVQVIALSILTCFIALAFESVRKLWSEGFNGTQENITLEKVTAPGIENITVLVPYESDTTSESEGVIISGCFKDVDSSKLKPQACKTREEFLECAANHHYSPLIISKSPFVNSHMVSHLMQHKKQGAFRARYQEGDSITNMEGAMHAFVTSVAKIEMTIDYFFWNNSPSLTPGKSRSVILSSLIHPDFFMDGRNEVTMPLIECKKEEIQGFNRDIIPLAHQYDPKSPEFKESLEGHEADLLKAMIYHLRLSKRLPSLDEVADQAMDAPTAIENLEHIISDETIEDVAKVLEPLFANVNGHVISLEALFMIYYHQISNEFCALEEALPQGYVYTIDTSFSLATEFGGKKNVPLLNRLQILAFKQLQNKSSFANLKVIGFNDSSLDPGAIALYKGIFKNIEILPKKDLFQGKGSLYSGREGLALVEHTNGNAFEDKITQGRHLCKEGIIGGHSDAALELSPQRSDLMNFVI